MGFESLRVLVVLRVICLELRVEEFDDYVPMQMVYAAFRVLKVGGDVIVAARRCIDTRDFDAEVGALDRGAILRRRRRRRIGSTRLMR